MTQSRAIGRWRRFAELAGRSVFLAAALPAPALWAEPVPVMVRSAPGRFEIAAMDAGVAHAVSGVAEEIWRQLAGPLGLPDGFSTPVFVRLVPAVETHAPDAAFGANVEAGGVVSIWIRQAGAASVPARPIVQRALARGLLLRLGVTMHGTHERLTVPRWLERAAVAWCDTRTNPAWFDAVKFESRSLGPPGLANLLADEMPEADARREAIAGLWLLTFLQGESGRAGEWPTFLRDVLGGRDPDSALNEAFAGRFETPAERELWWQTGWHQLRRVRSLPTLEASESRQELAALTRFIFAPDDKDVVMPLRDVLAHGRDPLVAPELKRRAAEVERLLPALHPFYRNAGLSLVEVFQAGALAATKREAACARFEQDWRDATELEGVATAALDAMEGGPRR